MRYRLLGRTGLYVSEICLGTMTYGGKGRWEPIGRLGVPDAQAQIKAAFDDGVNFVDTANVYSEGVSESIVGEALANLGLPREDLVRAGGQSCHLRPAVPARLRAFVPRERVRTSNRVSPYRNDTREIKAACRDIVCRTSRPASGC